MKSIYNKFIRMYWGANQAKSGVMRRSVKKAARRIDAKIAKEN